MVPPRFPALLFALALAVAAFLLAFVLGLRSEAGRSSSTPASPYRGSVSPHVPLPDFALRDQFGRPARLRDFRGKPLLIAFVYALCRDVCPLTAAKIAWALDRLSPDAAKLNVIAISVQPHTDTPRRVIAFSRKHRLLHRWRYLIGPPARVLPVLKAMGVAPEELPAPGQRFARNGEDGAHGAWLFLADRDLRRVESWPQSMLLDPHDLLHDLRLLLRGVPARTDG